MPKRAKSPAPKKDGRPRRTKAEVQAILDKIDALRAQGKSITAALREVKVPYTNYNYWTKKQGKKDSSGFTVRFMNSHPTNWYLDSCSA
jgi:hypothetical protein